MRGPTLTVDLGVRRALVAVGKQDGGVFLPACVLVPCYMRGALSDGIETWRSIKDVRCLIEYFDCPPPPIVAVYSHPTAPPAHVTSMKETARGAASRNIAGVVGETIVFEAGTISLSVRRVKQ